MAPKKTEHKQIAFDAALDIMYCTLNADEREAVKGKLLPESVSKILDDSELVDSLESLFENSLNISEASKNTFVHRNTLVYRLNKIQSKTGLDMRKFEDASVMRMCMWLKNKDKQNERTK